MTLGIVGKYNFTPCEAGVLSPELYGLDTVSIPNVAQAEKQKPAIAAHDKKKVHIKRTEKIIPSALTANWLTTWQLRGNHFLLLLVGNTCQQFATE